MSTYDATKLNKGSEECCRCLGGISATSVKDQPDKIAGVLFVQLLLIDEQPAKISQNLDRTTAEHRLRS